MQQELSKKLKVLIVLVLVLVLTALVLAIFRSMQFRVVGTDPKTKSVTVFNRSMKINFSHELSTEGLSVKGSEGLIGSSSVSGKTLTLQFNSLKPQTYTITIESATSKSGKKIMNKSLSFTAKEIAYDNLPESQKKKIMEDDLPPKALQDPIFQYLPYGSLNYKLTAEQAYDEKGQERVVIIAEILPSAADVRGTAKDKENAIALYQQQVTDYLRSVGLDPSKYTIQYRITEPSIY